MFSKVVAYAGALVDAFLAGSGADPQVQATGFRVIPVLANGASVQNVIDAYNGLQVRVTKQTKNFPAGVTEILTVVGPDWVTAVGMGHLELLAGGAANNLLVEIATDCKEMQFVTAPWLPGFQGSGTSPGAVASSASTDQNLTGTAPTLNTDGFSIANGKALRVSWKAKNAGATLNAAGKALAYAYSAAANRWWRLPELDVDFTALNTPVVEPMGVGPAPWALPSNVDRMDYQPSAMTVSAGTQVTRLQELIK